MRVSGIERLGEVRAVGHTGDGLTYAARVDAQHAQAELISEHGRRVPDKKGLLAWCGSALGASTVWELARGLEYDGPVEMLSGWLCLFSSPELVTDSSWSLLAGPRVQVIACPVPYNVC
jgi:hypothetical protein